MNGYALQHLMDAEASIGRALHLLRDDAVPPKLREALRLLAEAQRKINDRLKSPRRRRRRPEARHEVSA